MIFTNGSFKVVTITNICEYSTNKITVGVVFKEYITILFVRFFNTYM